MNKLILAVLAIFVGIVFFAVAIAGASYVSANNYGSEVEANLKASRDNNKNILAQYQQKVLEAVQVPEMYKNDFKEVLQGSLTGRYGPDGSKATFQWIKEHDINFDSSLYRKVQQLIEGGRKDFELGQTRMLDIRRGYETNLGYAWRGLWLRIAGFPKIDLTQYNPITTAGVEDTFASGKEKAPLKLR